MSAVLIEDLYESATTVRTGHHHTTVNELTDQRPALRAAVLAEACDRLRRLGSFANVDKLLVEEDKGAILAGPLCLATGLPLAVARWYPYRLDGLGAPVIEVPITSEYFSGTLYVNGVEPGERVVIIDDTVSTGGTLAALIGAVHTAGAEVAEILVVTEKVRGGGVRAIRERFGIEIKSVIRIDVEPGRVRVVGRGDDR